MCYCILTNSDIAKFKHQADNSVACMGRLWKVAGGQDDLYIVFYVDIHYFSRKGITTSQNCTNCQELKSIIHGFRLDP